MPKSRRQEKEPDNEKEKIKIGGKSVWGILQANEEVFQEGWSDHLCQMPQKWELK